MSLRVKASNVAGLLKAGQEGALQVSLERSRKRNLGSSLLLDAYQAAFRVRRRAFGDMHRF